MAICAPLRPVRSVRPQLQAGGLRACDRRLTAGGYADLRRPRAGRIIAAVKGSEAPGRVRFCVLGPLEVLRDGERVRLGGQRQRALLALLLMHANEPVSVDRLVAALFGEERAEGAVNAVRVGVSRLRAAIEPDQLGAIVRTTPGGYLLAAADDELDLAIFERSLREARALGADHPARAAALLREALALWRGPPLADLASLDCLQDQIRRLEQLRLLAVIERIDADLALGAGADLIAELEQLVGAEPLQERLRGQLMLALYRAGRQADALAVYRETRELLREQLGLEPSHALRELERSILSHDGSLEPGPPEPSSSVAANLPVPPTAFLGRVRELGEISALLKRSDSRLVTLTGAGGSGKTRLALRVAESQRHDHQDAPRFVGFADITDPDLIAPTICEAVGLAEHAGMTPMQRIEQWLADRRLLVVLDNLEQLTAGAALLGQLLAACPGLTLLVTSREPLHLSGERQYEVSGLDRSDAVELFTTRAQAIKPDAELEAELTEAICERLDRLPLAIELAAARTKALSPTELLARLDTSLPLLTGGPRDAPRRQETLKATIDWSYQLLSPDEQRLFARLSVFAGGCTLAAAEAVCQADLDTLQALVDRSLVRSDAERYWMLQTIREYAFERLEQTGEAARARRAHAHWLVALVDAEGIAAPGWPDERSLKRLEPEHENFRAALEWASNVGAMETLARLASALSAVWVIQGQLHEAQRWITLMLQHQDQYSGRLAAQAVSAGRRLARHQGNKSEAAAFASRALELWRATGDREAIGRALVDVGVDVGFTAVSAGDLPGGRRVLEQAIQFSREHALRDVLPAALNNLADLAILEGTLEEGRALCEESLAATTPGSALADIALMNLAHIEMLEGNPTDAINAGRQALDGALRRGDLLWIAWAAIDLAWPLAEQSQFEQAGRLLGAALAFIDTAGAGKDWMDEACEQQVWRILREQLGEPTAQSLINQGRTVHLQRAARDALDEPTIGPGHASS